MSLNTYPYNPFPASTDKLDEAHNAELQQEVDQLKEDTGELQEDVEKLETDKTDTAVIAPEFDAEAGVYAVGDLVMYQGKLYEFTTAHETAGDWDNTEVAEKTVSDEIDTVKSGLTNVDNATVLNTQDLTTPSRTKNILPMTVEGIKAANTDGTWSGNSYTLNNITYTINTDADGNIVNVTVNTGSGGASGDGSFYLYNGDFTSGNYIINGITGGNESYIFIGIISSDVYKCTNGDLSAALGNTINCFIITKQGSNVNKIITPMIRLDTETDAAFAPYIQSVESRLEALEAAIAQLTNS